MLRTVKRLKTATDRASAPPALSPFYPKIQGGLCVAMPSIRCCESGLHCVEWRPVQPRRSRKLMLTPEVIQEVATLLGRQPRGLEDVAVSGPAGEPQVIRVASLVDDKPFPTLFWLVDRALCYRIDQAEAGGLIAQFQRRIDADAGLRRSMREDHRAHIALREDFMSPSVRGRLQALNYAEALARRGIGGIADRSRIRCLHTWYGAHLVVPNTVGRMLDDWWSMQST